MYCTAVGVVGAMPPCCIGPQGTRGIGAWPAGAGKQARALGGQPAPGRSGICPGGQPFGGTTAGACFAFCVELEGFGETVPGDGLTVPFGRIWPELSIVPSPDTVPPGAVGYVCASASVCVLMAVSVTFSTGGATTQVTAKTARARQSAFDFDIKRPNATFVVLFR